MLLLTLNPISAVESFTTCPAATEKGEQEEEEEDPHLFNGFMDGFNDEMEEEDASMNPEIDIADGIYNIVKNKAAAVAAEAMTTATNVHKNSKGL